MQETEQIGDWAEEISERKGLRACHPCSRVSFEPKKETKSIVRNNDRIAEPTEVRTKFPFGNKKRKRLD